MPCNSVDLAGEASGKATTLASTATPFQENVQNLIHSRVMF